jgi:hypothetical protein
MRPFIAALAASLLITASAQAAVPTATTGNANAITQTTARLHGAVKPNGQNTTWHFEFGTTTAYGTATPEQGPVVAGSGNANVVADIGALAPGTIYHYRLVATNVSGSIPGRDRTFTTRSAVALNASSTSTLFNRNVTLTGQVFGSAVAGVTVTLQENPYPFSGWNDVSTTTTDTSGRYQFIRQLKTNTAWRVVAGTRPPGTSNTAFTLEQDTLSLKANTTRPRRGHTVLFTGFSTPARIGSTVYIQRLGKHGWRTALTAKLSPTPVADFASYAVRLRHLVSGLYRASVPSGYDHLGTTTKSKRITIRR